jgi:hypothetical protein
MLGIAAVSAVMVLNAAPAKGQQLSYAVGTERREDPTQLERQAAELYESPKNFKRAAGLLMRAAGMREAGDPQKVRNQSLAARLYYYAGDRDRSFTLLTETADYALSVGDVVTAAELYLDASSVAQELERGDEVLRLAHKAQLLLRSPLVSAVDRQRLLVRIAG